MELKVIPPRSGAAFELDGGSYLKVICPEGKQVSDMLAYRRNDVKEWMSNGKTFDYEQTLRLTEGNSLYSNKSNAMLDIVEDTCKIHDFLLAPCCPETLRIFYGMEGERPTCRGNLYKALRPYGIDELSIPTAFNIFMNVPIGPDLAVSVDPPKAKPGDYIVFRARMDLLIALTACSAGASNDYVFKPIEYCISTTGSFRW